MLRAVLFRQTCEKHREALYDTGEAHVRLQPLLLQRLLDEPAGEVRKQWVDAAATFAATGEQWLSYLTTVLQPKYPGGIPLHRMQEMKT